MTTNNSVSLRPGSIWIQDRPVILVTSSLFYFRIPASEWRERMRTLCTLGYNAIDVYFPWNHHEIEPGRWEFDGERDVRTFLRMAREEGLWVVARPGPYICSEWDGGSLPAWLNASGLDLRQNSRPYLEQVERWYDQILPILAEFQIEREGPIILVQLENELDFFDCSDRPGMMTALRDMALGHGITVPLVACAGQGDVSGATGQVPGVVPACNFYFENRDANVEERIRHYAARLKEQGFPLCVTETNRSHTELRRLLVGGAKLLGPYLQAGGTDFGYSTSITNWGAPLAFLTSHYDLGGMLSPGGKVRPEGREALVFTKMLSALGPDLALADPLPVPPVAVHGLQGHALALGGGGCLIGLPNLGEKAVQVHLGDDSNRYPARTDLLVAASSCPFLLSGFPLADRGIDAMLRYATVELVACKREAEVLELTFAVEAQAEIALEWAGASLSVSDGWLSEAASFGWRLWLAEAKAAEARFAGPQGEQLVLKAVPRDQVGDLELAGLDEKKIAPSPSDGPGSEIPVRWQRAALDPCSRDWFAAARLCHPDRLQLEQNGIDRGTGFYRAKAADLGNAQGLLVRSGADVLSIYRNSVFLETIVPGGGDAFVPLPQEVLSGNSELVVRAEIWGHSNFDDHRLPALRLKAMRGLSGMAAIFRRENVSANWFYQRRAVQPSDPPDPAWPCLQFGGWSSTDEPARGVYHREISFEQGLDTCVLHFPGIQMSARVLYAGEELGSVNPYDPFVDLSPVLTPGTSSRIAVAVEQDFRLPAGQVWMLQGNSIRTWEVAGWGEKEFSQQAQRIGASQAELQFPYRPASGEMAWLQAALPLDVDWELGWDLQFVGQGIKVSAWIGDRLAGRIWLPSGMRPPMKGGADDRMVLPASWLRAAQGRISLLIESVSPGAELLAPRFILDR